MDFRATYKRNDYINFFRNYLLPEDFLDYAEDVSLGFKPQHISKVIKIGEVPSLELNIYEVAHPAENDPRVSLSRDAFRILAQYGVKRALIVFNSETSSNFRLSLVTIDLKWEEGKRVQKEYSNPRRYSFFLGPETKTHTPEEYLIKQARVKDFDDLKNRFSIEVVNKDFYTQIAVLFTQMAGGKRTIGRKSIDAGRGLLNLPSTVDDILDKEFTVRLIGRLVFCWFLKKKRSDKNIPLLPEELLSAKAVSENKGYYHGILEPLFFEVLNTPVDSREKKYQNTPWSQIPFLNGGLFTPHHHDFYEPGPLGISKHINTLKVPDQWIKELFEVFETYNFTIDENTSVDVELSIEPEMLGRIFENLLAEINPETGETARKATGSYYTPRPIVEYMVDESLKQYLLTKTKLDEIKIKSLLTYEDLAVKLSESERESVLTALDAVKVIDPACGSGAFPMGILQKMLLILQKVDPESEWWLERKLSQIESKLLKKELGKKLKSEDKNYVHKLGIIQGSIYGVDIQPIAVEISKLRFFLSLIVDERVNDAKENRGIEPLPNLEFKFVCTNSLIGLPKNEKSPDQLFETEDTQSINELKDLRDEYLRSYGIEKEKIQIKFLKIQKRMIEFYWQRILKPQTDLYGNKRELKKQEEPEFTRMLSSWDPFSEDPCGWFDPEWMFGIKNGFDIVITNPPYGIPNKKQNKTIGHIMSERELNYIKKSDLYKPALGGMMNTYRLFIVKGLSLLNNNGTMCQIFPLAFIGDSSAINLRKYLLDNSDLLKIEAFPERDNEKKRVFEAVKMSICILILRNACTGQGFALRTHNDRWVDTKKQGFILTKRLIELMDEKSYRFPMMNLEESVLFEKVLGNREIEKFGNISKCYTGEIDLTLDKKYLSDDKKLKKLLKGAQIDKYLLKDTMSQGEIKYLDSDNYLRDNGGPKSAHHSLRRIIMQGITGINEKTRLKATLIDSGIFCANSVNYILEDRSGKYDIRYLLACLNSKLSNWCFKKKSSNSNVNGYEVDGLPIRNITIDKQKPFIELIDKILKISAEKQYPHNESEQAKVKSCQQSIDNLIYELYSLTKKEIELVEDPKTEK